MNKFSDGMHNFTLDPNCRDDRDSCMYSLHGAMFITKAVFAFPVHHPHFTIFRIIFSELNLLLLHTPKKNTIRMFIFRTRGINWMRHWMHHSITQIVTETGIFLFFLCSTFHGNWRSPLVSVMILGHQLSRALELNPLFSTNVYLMMMLLQQNDIKWATRCWPPHFCKGINFMNRESIWWVFCKSSVNEPPRDSCKSLVSFESRKGTWVLLGSVLALMHLPTKIQENMYLNGVILEVKSSPALVLHPVFFLIPTLLLSKKSQKYLTKHQNLTWDS